MVTSQNYPAWTPPACPALRAQLLNTLCTRALPWPVSLPGLEGEARPAPFALPFTAVCGVALNCGGELWRVELGGLDALRRHPALSEIPVDTPLPAPVALAALAAATEPLCTRLGQLLGLPVAIHDAALLPAADNASPFAGMPPACCEITLELALPATATLPASVIPIRVGFPDAGSVQRLCERLSALPGPPQGPHCPFVLDVPFAARLVAGEMTLPAAAFSSLETGDILFPESYSAADGRILFRIPAADGGMLTISCDVRDGVATVGERSAAPQEHTMSEQNTAESTRDDIAITLSFELERRQLTLKDLDALVPGYTFALAADLAAPVTLCANGKAIGKGRLVDISGKLGVQIAEIR